MRSQEKLFVIIASILVIVGAGYTGYALFATKDTDTTKTATVSATDSASTTTTPTTSEQSSTSSSESTGYKDGTYTSSVTYSVPHGETNSLSVTLTIANGAVSNVSTNSSYDDHESAEYIDWFEQEIASVVTGKSLNGLSVSRVGEHRSHPLRSMTRLILSGTMQQPNIYEFEAIGTHWWIEPLEGTRFSHETKCATSELVATFDQLYSRFRSDSLITRLNTANTLIRPSDELLSMFRFCEEMYDVSQGAFNISVGGRLHELGYGSRALAGSTYENPWQHIRYDAHAISVPEDMTIDTGGYGKGWLIDVIAELLKSRGYNHFIINGGGDMYIDSAVPIEIALEHPHDETRQVGTTRISKGALAVSGTSKRAWTFAGKHYHHIIDPHTNTSLTSDVVGVYVRAETALLADTMATILMIRPDLTRELSDTYKLKAVVLRESQLS